MTGEMELKETAAILLRGAELDGARRDISLAGGLVRAIAPAIDPTGHSLVIEADGGALLPGLHDHHIHINATAAAFNSALCGPPAVHDAASLIAALHDAPGEGWLRGIGYHDSVAGAIDRDWLDRNAPSRPIRIQHRSGRLWMMNGLALAAIGADPRADGRFLDSDAWLKDRLPIVAPDLLPVGRALAAFGVTGLTEVTPRNDLEDYRRYALAGLPQRLLVMGRRDLDDAAPIALTRRGAVKLHYHDHDLPGLDALAQEVAGAHAAGRPVASHCVTPAELMLTLAAIEMAGPYRGDRIEHGAIIGPETCDWIARLGLTVVSQPHFLAERAGAYRTDVDAVDRPFLYRLAGLKRAGIPIAAGSDAPFGGLDPWVSMAAAVERPAGFGADEALTPEAALALYTGPAEMPGGPPRQVREGEPADVCLLDRPWASARRDLAAVRVRLTLVDGRIVHRAD
ncbi:amidohydrolase family protein [Sphingobium sp. AP49]|uniref:amidohydrolase family protein n=1 Tax=Sphingobium sp. AP49 TaxID=1144307 RepID=UPI00026ED8D0|nr:amidohydrolase family protein [Sphingobium sp. AP49]WHO37275.1 amidohydrolase family protein [Sphingobium sp. AP49]